MRAPATTSIACRTQRGAALIVGLLMLVVLTVLAISGLSTATIELTMAGNNQHSNRAFEAAAAVLESEIRRTDLTPLAAPGNLASLPANVGRVFKDNAGNTVATATAGTRFVATTGVAGWQLGAGHSFSAHHFEGQGNGTSARGATTNQLQGYYVVGPGN